MHIYVNGELREVGEELSLQSLVDTLKLASERVAIELNRSVVRPTDWPTTILNDSDRVEIVQFVGGGLEARPFESVISKRAT